MLPLYSIIFKSKKIAKQLSFKVAKHQRIILNKPKIKNESYEWGLTWITHGKVENIGLMFSNEPSSDEAHVTENSFFFLVFVKKAKRSVHI